MSDEQLADEGYYKDPVAHEPEMHHKEAFPVLVLGALGVVYGDIGTSPLYALRESLGELYEIPVVPDNILGVLSLIFWSLILVISVKYVLFVMRADHHGEGGILADCSRHATWERIPHASASLADPGAFRHRPVVW